MMEDPDEETVMSGLVFELGRYKLLLGFSTQRFAVVFVLLDNEGILHVGPFNAGVSW